MTLLRFDLDLTSKILNISLLWFFEQFEFENHAFEISLVNKGTRAFRLTCAKFLLYFS